MPQLELELVANSYGHTHRKNNKAHNLISAYGELPLQRCGDPNKTPSAA